MAGKVPKQNDIIVGSNVRRMRLARNISQEKLGDALGLTFQQVQKYEKGTNRIGSSRLIEITGALACSMDDLFRGVVAPRKNGGTIKAVDDPLREMASTRRGTDLARAFPKLTPREQQAVVLLVEEMVEDR